jgi:hypothetical protein
LIDECVERDCGTKEECMDMMDGGNDSDHVNCFEVYNRDDCNEPDNDCYWYGDGGGVGAMGSGTCEQCGAINSEYECNNTEGNCLWEQDNGYCTGGYHAQEGAGQCFGECETIDGMEEPSTLEEWGNACDMIATCDENGAFDECSCEDYMQSYMVIYICEEYIECDESGGTDCGMFFGVEEDEYVPPVECVSGQFTCQNGECLDSSKVCDGVPNDCSDNSDEMWCDDTMTTCGAQERVDCSGDGDCCDES